MKTLRKIEVTAEFVTEMPFHDIQENVLYVNKETMRCRHLCLCGCKSFIDIPLTSIQTEDFTITSNDNEDWWHLTMKDGKATVKPSILNTPCNGHYVITKGIANII